MLDQEHLAALKDGAIIANSGHFNDEINIPALEALATGGHKPVRDFVEEYAYADGRKVYLLADGRLVNLSAADGHPASVMDMSFANQALGAEYMLAERQEPGAACLHDPGRHRPRDRAPQAPCDGHRDRHPDAGAEGVPRGLGVGDLVFV